MLRVKLFVATVGLIALTVVGCGNPAPSGKSTPSNAASGGGTDPASGSGVKGGAAPAGGSGAK